MRSKEPPAGAGAGGGAVAVASSLLQRIRRGSDEAAPPQPPGVAAVAPAAAAAARAAATAASAAAAAAADGLGTLLKRAAAAKETGGVTRAAAAGKRRVSDFAARASGALRERVASISSGTGHGGAARAPGAAAAAPAHASAPAPAPAPVPRGGGALADAFVIDDGDSSGADDVDGEDEGFGAHVPLVVPAAPIARVHREGVSASSRERAVRMMTLSGLLKGADFVVEDYPGAAVRARGVVWYGTRSGRRGQRRGRGVSPVRARLIGRGVPGAAVQV